MGAAPVRPVPEEVPQDVVARRAALDGEVGVPRETGQGRTQLPWHRSAGKQPS